MGNVSSKENNVVVVKQERTSSLTGYSHYSPSSPSDSWISTDDFPAELDELNEQFEIQLVDKIQLAEEPCSKALQTPEQESSSSAEEEGKHVEDLAVDREAVEGSGDEPLCDHVGGRA